jgi:hypothetical protein
MPQPVAPIEIKSLGNIPCEVCHVTMKLYGVESHPTIDGADLRTYVCPRCEAVQTAAAPNWSLLQPGEAFDAETTGLLASTFDAAWEAAVASDGSLADAQHEGPARQTLARCIIELIHQGETNPHRLAEDALHGLRKHGA